MSEFKLKPCPFCGGEARLVEHEDLAGIMKYYIECSDIECDVYPISNDFETKEEVIKAWNTRKPIERIVERLKEIVNLEIRMHGGRSNGKTLALGYTKGIENAIAIVKEGDENVWQHIE